MKLSVVTWLWQGNRRYLPEQVGVLASMFRRHLSIPHRFICISDAKGSFGDGVEVMPMPSAAAQLGKLTTPEGMQFPSCYRRLWMFSEEAKCLGDRVLLIDLDVVLTNSVDHLFASRADFVGWQPRAVWGGQRRLGGGMYLLTPGTRSDVFDDFAGEPSIAEARAAGFRGSDQAWISYKLRDTAELWPDNAGIYSVRDLVRDLPSDACLVQFNGQMKPWHRRLPWIDRHWR